MPENSLESAFTVLGVAPNAAASEVQRAFRRLAKRHHPDVSRRSDAAQHFGRIVAAYRAVCEARPGQSGSMVRGPCPYCGRPGDLFGLLDGRQACADCLFGGMRGRRFLPGPPPLATACRYGGVLALYTIAGVFLVYYFRNAAAMNAVLGLTCLWTGFALLVIEVLRIVRNIDVRRRRYRPPAARMAAPRRLEA